MKSERIIVIPSGRRDRMSILMIYIDRLISLKLVDRVHLWMFPRNEEDFKWIQSLQTDTITIMYPEIASLPDKNKELWENNQHYDARQDELFKHYSDEKYKNCIFIKLDDDIVWININEIDNLFNICEHNHDISVITPLIVNNLNLKPVLFEKIPEGVGNDHTRDAWYAEQYHDRFLVNSQKLANDLRPNYYNTRINDDIETLNDRYFCINFICFKYNVFEEIKKYMKEYASDFNDEIFISTLLPRITGKPNILFNRIVASHLSYFQQEKQMNIQKYIDLYRLKATYI